MKKLALPMLLLPHAGCAGEPAAVTQNCAGLAGTDYHNCAAAYTPHFAPVSHWHMTTDIYRGFDMGAAASASSGPSPGQWGQSARGP